MLDNIFSVSIYHTKFEDLEMLARARNVVSSENIKNIHTHGEFELLTDFVEQEAKKYWDMLGYYPDIYPKIWQSLATIKSEESDMYPHNHCRSPLNATLYLEAHEGDGIVFQNPLDLILGSQPIKMPYKNFLNGLESQTGSLVLFPGWLKHYTQRNTSNKPCVTFSSALNERGY
jgi:hypothetical protein